MTQGIPSAAAVVVGGGSGTRYGGDKLIVPLAGEPLIAWTLRAFEQTPAVTQIILVVGAGREEEFRALAAKAGITKLTVVVAGGEHRHDSVIRGLRAVRQPVELVAIHDAARPLVTPGLITRCLETAADSRSAAAAAPVTDTLHLADQEGCAARTVDRTGLWAVQTPQVFRHAPLLELLGRPSDPDPGSPTDEVSVALAAGWRIPFVPSQEPNPKVTWPADVALAEALLLSRRAAP